MLRNENSLDEKDDLAFDKAISAPRGGGKVLKQGKSEFNFRTDEMIIYMCSKFSSGAKNIETPPPIFEGKINFRGHKTLFPQFGTIAADSFHILG